MENKIPAYAPIKGFDFDNKIFKKEIDVLIKSQAQERTLPFKDGKSIYDSKGLLKIADDKLLNDTSRYYLDENNNRIYVAGKLKTYHVFNLTYLENEPESLIDIYRSSDPKKAIFWHKYYQPFTWRDNLKSSKIKEFIDSLPFEYVQGVRLIFMDPPSLGQIHRDSHTFANKKYFQDGFASISLNIDTGGGILKFLDNKDSEREVDNTIKIFHFDDSVAHGVTPISSARYQIRIWGKLNVDYNSLFDLDKAIYK
jgi:hypothetical protein